MISMDTMHLRGKDLREEGEILDALYKSIKDFFDFDDDNGWIAKIAQSINGIDELGLLAAKDHQFVEETFDIYGDKNNISTGFDSNTYLRGHGLGFEFGLGIASILLDFDTVIIEQDEVDRLYNEWLKEQKARLPLQEYLVDQDNASVSLRNNIGETRDLVKNLLKAGQDCLIRARLLSNAIDRAYQSAQDSNNLDSDGFYRGLNFTLSILVYLKDQDRLGVTPDYSY
ncbi:hypothetical protein KC853_01265 [Candidatus Saccharibacteria bacterium]|nr:hypothetical protein [Candidatus Saccharibacteria bacterium]MCB9834524.1 hypothetical protein [Candidatus Nomurabacteria bacterium]